MILSPSSGGLPTCMYWWLLSWRLQEDPAQISGVLSVQCPPFVPLSCLRELSLDSQLHLLISESPPDSIWTLDPYTMSRKLTPGSKLGNHEAQGFFHLSGITVFCFLMSNVLQSIFKYILSVLSVASGRRIIQLLLLCCRSRNQRKSLFPPCTWALDLPSKVGNTIAASIW